MTTAHLFDLMEPLACGHVRTGRIASGIMGCPCCRREHAAMNMDITGRYACVDCHQGFREMPKHLSFRNDVVMAQSVGVCMFCSDPHASMMFRDDESVRICKRCVQ